MSENIRNSNVPGSKLGPAGPPFGLILGLILGLISGPISGPFWGSRDLAWLGWLGLRPCHHFTIPDSLFPTLTN